MASSSSSDKNPCVLQDVFYSYPRLSSCTLCLTERKLYVRKLFNGREEQNDINVCDITGCRSVVFDKTHRNGNNNKTSKSENNGPFCCLRLYYYPLKVCGGILSKQLRREKYVTNFVMRKHKTIQENSAEVNKWKNVILWMLHGKRFGPENTYAIPEVFPTSRKLLFIVNPHSGPGRALDIFDSQIVPMLTESDIDFEMLITDRANFGKDFVKSADLSKWDGIVSVSGDGLLFEIYNGLMEREDWESAVKVPVGIIPGGSGNGLARTISYALDEPYDTAVVTSSVLNILKGRVSPMDLIKVETPTNNIYSFLSIGWGLMADIDIESENLRAIGEARFAVWAVIRALGLRIYKGRLSYLPVIGYQSPKTLRSNNIQALSESRANKRSKTFLNPITKSNNYYPSHGYWDTESEASRSKSFTETRELSGSRSVELLRYKSLKDDPVLSFKDDVEEIKSNGYHSSNGISQQTSDNFNTTSSLMSVPPLSEPVPDDWTIVEGNFVLVYAAHQSHLSSDVLFAPEAKLDDGIIWLVTMRDNVSRAQVIYFLASLNTGDHVNIPYVDAIPVHAFRLEPDQPNDVLTVDGEVIPCSAIQATVCPSLARIMTR